MKKLVSKYVKWTIPVSISFLCYVSLLNAFKDNYDNHLKVITVILCLFLPLLFEQWSKRLKEIEGDKVE